MKKQGIYQLNTNQLFANYTLNDSAEDTENESIFFNRERSIWGHAPSRCGCFACRGTTALPPRDLEPNSAFDTPQQATGLGEKISSTPANTNFYGKSSSETEALTLDSLAALDSPYIAGTFVAAKWGAIDPDSGTTTELSYYITPAGVTLSDGSTSVASTAAERSAIAIANAAFTDVANLSFTETSTGDTDANFRWSFATGSALGRADFPGLYGNVTSDVITFSNAYSGISGALDAGGYYYITMTHELGHAMGLAHPHDGGGAWTFYPYNSNFGSELYPGVSASTSGGNNYLNSTPYSVMTYNDASSTLTSENSEGTASYVTPRAATNYGFNEGLGAFDIATLQYLYGPNTSKSAPPRL